MHAFCQSLVDGVSDLRSDSLAARGVIAEFEEILAECDSGADSRTIVNRLVGVMFQHPVARRRMSKFVVACATRGGVETPADLPKLDELRATLRLVLNSFVVAAPPTIDDFAAECLVTDGPAAATATPELPATVPSEGVR